MGFLSSFATRTDTDEQMDDFSITDERLTTALEQLRWVNRLLGGYSTTMKVLGPFLQSRRGKLTHILDLGTGIGDFPEYIVGWCAQQNLDIKITAIDANPATVAYANGVLDTRLTPNLRSKIEVVVADALDLSYSDRCFDLAMGAMFLHHFAEEKATIIVKSMARVADNILINDLHRHPLAYWGIYSLTRLFSAAEMVKNDGPLSVLRGFQAPELRAIAQGAGLKDFSLEWHLPFRWLLTTVKL